MRKYIPSNAKLIPENAERTFKGIIFDVYQWEQELFDGSTTTFEMLDRPDTTIALCIKGDKIIVQEEEQPHVGVRKGIPGGRADVPSENELEAIQREVLEETGMKFASWRLIEAKQLLGKIDHLIYLFVASDFESQTEPQLDAGEKITITEVSFDEFKQAYENKEIDDVMPEMVLECESIDDLRSLPDLYDTV